MRICGKDMGGIWLPDRFGITVFVPLRCNDSLNHLATHCSYLDEKSGLLVTRRYDPSVNVDARGCVTTHLNESTPLMMQMEARELGDRKVVGAMSPELRCAAKRSGTRDAINVQAIAEHQAKICECYDKEKS